MKRSVLIVLLMTALAAVAANNEEVESLKARAANTNRGDQVKLFTRVAELQLKELSKAYEQGNPEQAEAALHDVLEYGVKAAQSSEESRKRMKQTEIAIRKISNRLDDIGKTLSFDERQPVTEAVKKLEDARSSLLHAMFRKD
jgi:membrane-bound lytic murein transglycosylase